MGSVAEGEYKIVNSLGLHARAAAQLVKVANLHQCDVSIACEGQVVNGKSIMGVLMLAAAQGMTVKVRCEGVDSDACLQEIAGLITSGFGESH